MTLSRNADRFRLSYGNAIPDLAQKCDIAADGRTYTFHLREGVRFHNGQEMTAQDVKTSFERYARVGASAAMMKPVDSITPVSKYVVRVQLKQPVVGFIDQISSPRAPVGIMPESEADKDRGKINHIGTGPYQFVEFKPDSHVRLKRFDGYTPNTNYTKRDGYSVAGYFITEQGGKGGQHMSDPELQRTNEALNKSLKLEDRVKAFADFQRRFFEFVPAIKVGDLGRYQATRANVVGYAPGRIPRKWDVWFE